MMAVFVDRGAYLLYFLALKVSPIASLVSIFGSDFSPFWSSSLEELHFADGLIGEHGRNSSPASAPGHHVASGHPR